MLSDLDSVCVCFFFANKKKVLPQFLKIKIFSIIEVFSLNFNSANLDFLSLVPFTASLSILSESQAR